MKNDGTEVWGRKSGRQGGCISLPVGALACLEEGKESRAMVGSAVSASFHGLRPQQQELLGTLGFNLPPNRKDCEQKAWGLAVNSAEGAEGQKTRERELEKIRRQLYLLHAATGHCSTRHLVLALKRRHASAEIIKMAEDFKCSICEERKRVTSRHVSSLEPLPPKFQTISADIGHWMHPTTHEQVQFMVILDEGSRYRTARILTRGSKQTPNGATCVQYLREGWAQYFGNPRTIRLDPAGSFRSRTVADYCDRHGIFLDLVPGEAHWKIGGCEQAVQGLKSVMDKLCHAEETLEPEEALATAVRVFNQRDIIRGFSPSQHVLGQAPDETGRIHVGPEQVPPESLIENPSREFEASVQRRVAAEQAHSEWQARQRLVRAANSKSKQVLDFQPGELVYFWRSQEAGKSRKAPGNKHGRFLGPARILAVEPKRQPDGSLMPGSAVWCVRGRSLVKCCPEQLRHASQREELLESLVDHSEAPWTFTRVAQQLGGTQFEDVSHEKPDLSEWQRAQDVEREQQPTRQRITKKRPHPAPQDLPSMDPEEEMIPDELMAPNRDRPSSSSQNPRRERGAYFSEGVRWWEQVVESAWSVQEAGYWMNEEAAVTMEIELPSDTRGLNKALGNFEVFFMNALKRKSIEVNEKRLTAEEREMFREAKTIEVKNFVAAQAFEALPEELRPSLSQAIGMRWILTWKQKPDGNAKAKARAVLLGYQDPSYEHRDTTAPVMTRQSRQMLLQQAANRSWVVYKGDVSGAFLQGRQYPTDLYCVPCPEILEALKLPPNSVTKLKRACYGLVDAPLEWWRSVDEFLVSLGLQRSWADACTWMYRDRENELKGLISGHVDDFLFAGGEEDVGWQAIIKAVKERFRWGDWERDTVGFVQCGVKILRTEEGFTLSQEQYVEGLKRSPSTPCEGRIEGRKPTTGKRLNYGPC